MAGERIADMLPKIRSRMGLIGLKLRHWATIASYGIDSINKKAAGRFQVSVQFVAGMEIIVFFVWGFTMIQVDEYAIADCLWIGFAGVLTIRIIGSKFDEKNFWKICLGLVCPIFCTGESD